MSDQEDYCSRCGWPQLFPNRAAPCTQCELFIAKDRIAELEREAESDHRDWDRQMCDLELERNRLRRELAEARAALDDAVTLANRNEQLKQEAWKELDEANAEVERLREALTCIKRPDFLATCTCGREHRYEMGDLNEFIDRVLAGEPLDGAA